MDQISNYSTLQSAVAGMIHRDSDTNITANIPLWIQLCEADLNDRMLLRDMESEETLTLTLGNNYVALPTGFLSPIAFWLVISNIRRELTPAAPEQLTYSPNNSIPQFYAIDADNIRFECNASDNFDARFRMVKKSNLSVSNTSNYLLTRRPDVYLYGTLKQVATFTEDDAQLQKWSALYESACRGAQALENRSKAIIPLRTDVFGAKNYSPARFNIYRG